MTSEERINQWKIFPTPRGQFSFELYKAMAIDDRIVLVTADLGYKVFDAHKEDFKDRYYNVGASEQAAAGICVGLALSDKIPFFYSITNFLLYRCFETLRNYVHYEKIPVKLIGAGRDKSYAHDGISHWSEDAKVVLHALPNIKTYWPNTSEEVTLVTKEILKNNEPCFVSLEK